MIDLRLYFNYHHSPFDSVPYLGQVNASTIANDKPDEHLRATDAKMPNMSFAIATVTAIGQEYSISRHSKVDRSASMESNHKTANLISNPQKYFEEFEYRSKLDNLEGVSFEKLMKIVNSHFAPSCSEGQLLQNCYSILEPISIAIEY